MAKYRGVTYRASKNLYEGRFQYNGESYSVYGKTAKEAADKLEELRQKVKTGLYCKPKDIRLNEWFNLWINDKMARGELRESTYEKYETVYRIHVAPRIGKKKLCDITPVELRLLITTDQEKGRRKNPQQIYIVLHGMFQAAMYDQMISVNPMQMVKPPKVEKKPPEEKRVMTREEQKIFTEYAADSIYNDFWMGMLSTGVRIGEMAALRWKDVSFERNEIKITGTLVYIRGKGRYINPPKTAAGRRTIPMLPALKRVLQKQRKEQLTNKMALGSAYKEEEGLEDVCFQYPDGGAIWTQSAYHDMERIVSKIQKDYPDFEPIHPHSLRHTFATRWIEGGGDLKTLQTILGHSTFAMTADLYSHVLPDTKQEEMKKAMGDLFS